LPCTSTSDAEESFLYKWLSSARSEFNRFKLLEWDIQRLKGVDPLGTD